MTSRAIAHNARAHDALGAGYDARHPEIYNPTEQARLADAVHRAAEVASGGARPVRALDVGCGTGNVTAHLIAAGATVTAADISATFLGIVRDRFAPSGKLDGVLHVNGHDLQGVPDRAFDVVTAYSVLHHVPDYVTLVGEMARVVAPGGAVLIDHERTDDSWTSPGYAEFLRAAVVWPSRRWWYWLQPSRYWRRMRPLLEWRRWGHPRWMPEGDLHVWPDDHVEWARVERVLTDAGCDVVVREAYLHFEPRYRRPVWESWRDRTADMQLLIARRRP